MSTAIGVPMVRKAPIVTGLTMTGGLVTAMMLGQAPTSVASPAIVATSPSDDATIAPGPFALTVTFDQPMRADSYPFTMIDGASFPRCAPGVSVSSDRRRFTMRCVAVAGARYGAGFNHGAFRNFRDADGVTTRGGVIGFTVR